jgi:multisubunit Na+/H+ antiporter MnhB subunit
MPAFDLLLCGSLIALALGVVTGRQQLFRSVIMFIAFGMLMALTWARLGSADLALAEAAIGAGFTGVLFLTASRMSARSGKRGGPMPRRPLAFAACLGAGAAFAVSMLRQVPREATTAALAATDEHVLGNAVTAVLLDFRGYDTLLEMVVLLLALLGLRVLHASGALPDPHPRHPVVTPMIAPLLAVEIPVLTLMALYLLYAGSDAPGGAFQAGALLGALGVMLRLSGRLVPAPALHPGARVAAIAGLGVFTLFACSSLGDGRAPLTWSDDAHLLLYFGIEVALMVSTATILVLLVGTAPGLKRVREQ